MATTNLGKVSMTLGGTYSAQATYARLTMVLGADGRGYVSKVDNVTGVAPGTTPGWEAYWQLISERGSGIASIAMTGTTGRVKTYTITYEGGATSTFDVTDGFSPSAAVTTNGRISTITITDADGTTTADVTTPTATVEKEGNVSTITITDADGTTEVPVEDGVAATITIGTTTTGAAGTQASVTNSGTENAAVLDFVIPRGDKGENGAVQTVNDVQPDAQGNVSVDASDIPLDKSVTGGPTVYDMLLNTRHYGVRWDKINAQMVRTGNAAGITTNTANFKHSGSKNAAKSNPFDSIYPWSGRKLCNINIDRYFALAAGSDLLSCVKAWEGDVDFSYDDADGVWVYTPEFWGKAWDADGYRYFDVTDTAVGGYAHYAAGISGRWHGGIYARTVDGASKTALLPKPGMPGKLVAMSTLHTYAKNYGATLDNIFSIDATSLLFLVEYANYNSQNSIGAGVHDLYRQSSDLLQRDVTDSATVKVLAANAGAVIVNAIMDIGATNGSASIGSFIVSAVETDPNDATLKNVTLTTDGVTPASVTATTANFWSIHGLANVADADIGSDSGYIGTNGQSNVYYRGETFAANLWYYILGAYREKDTGHVWIAHDEDEADAYDALNTAVHMDTGIALAQGAEGAAADGYINELGILDVSGLLCTPPFCTAIGGNSSNPVGDRSYTPALTTGNTVLLLGGYAGSGAFTGRSCGYWIASAGSSYWHFAARPRLKRP